MVASPDLQNPEGVYLFVLNEFGGTMSVVDVRLNDNKILWAHQSKDDADPSTFLDVGDYPVDLAVTAQGDRVFVCNASDEVLRAVDVGTWTVRRLDIPIGPCEMATVGDSIWIADPAEGRIVVLDPETESIADEIPLDETPVSLTASADGGAVFLTRGDDTLVKLDAETFSVLAGPVPFDGHPTRMAVPPAGDTLFVADDEPSRLHQLDPDTLAAVAAPLDIPGRLRNLLATPDNRWVYMVSDDGLAYVFSRRTGRTCNSYATRPEFEDVGAISDPTLTEVQVEDCRIHDEEWEVRYDQQEREWVVEGEKSGKQINRAQLDRTYVSDDGALQFVIEAGTRAPSDGDLFRFDTDPGISPIRVGSLPDGMAVIPDYDEPEYWIVWIANSLSDNLNNITTHKHELIGSLR
jgi:hypothetical protein